MGMIYDNFIADPKGHLKSAYERNIEKKLEEIKMLENVLLKYKNC